MTDTTQHDEELAQLKAQVVAQQARIVELHYYLSRAITTFRTIPKTVEKRARKVLATTDDLSALAEHDKQLWNAALTTGIEWQATRGHTLDADDYENEFRSLNHAAYIKAKIQLHKFNTLTIEGAFK